MELFLNLAINGLATGMLIFLVSCRIDVDFWVDGCLEFCPWRIVCVGSLQRSLGLLDDE